MKFHITIILDSADELKDFTEAMLLKEKALTLKALNKEIEQRVQHIEELRAATATTQ